MRRGRNLVSLLPLNCFRLLFSYFLVDFICDYEADDDPSWRVICYRKYNYCILFCVKLRPIFLRICNLFKFDCSFSTRGIFSQLKVL